MRTLRLLLALACLCHEVYAFENEAGVRVYTWEDYLAFLLGILLVAVGIAVIWEYLHGEGASHR